MYFIMSHPMRLIQKLVIPQAAPYRVMSLYCCSNFSRSDLSKTAGASTVKLGLGHGKDNVPEE